MLRGFRDFVMRGNVIDLAVAVVLAGAFGAVITSFVGDAVVRYGLFLNALIGFVLVAAAIYFVVVRPIERAKGEAAVTTKPCTECTSDIPLAAKRCPFCTQPQFNA